MTRFGVLQTSTSRVPALAAAGCDAANVELSMGFWFNNPGPLGLGQRNTGAYVGNMVGAVRACVEAGQAVTLGLGLHLNAPSWIVATHGTGVLFKNEFDHFSTKPGKTTFNMVFSAKMRQIVEAYVGDVKAVLNTQTATYAGETRTLWEWIGLNGSIRFADGTTGEAFYPQDQGADEDPDLGTPADPKYNYWAFDVAAQNGTGLASGMVAAPNLGMPTGAQVAPWIDWYLDARVRVALWFIDFVCRPVAQGGLEFAGEIDVVGPGSGVRPSALTTLRARTSLPSGHLLASGAVWATLYTALAAGPWASRTVVHCSSVADNSASDAPPQSGDLALTLNDPLADGFGSARWHRFVAAKLGLGLSMENPGSGPDYATTMMGDVFTIVKAAPETKRLLYARESAFFDGTLSLATYSESIADANATQQVRVRVSRLRVIAMDRNRVRVSRLQATTADPGTFGNRVRVSRLKATTATSTAPTTRVRVRGIRARTMVYSPGCYLWDGPGTEPYIARIDVWDGQTLTQVSGPELNDPDAPTPTYYLDPAGNDSNDGLTAATAWQTLGKLSTVTLKAGDIVGFKAGTVFRGSSLALRGSGTATNPVTFTRYGTGAAPVLSGGQLITGWVASGTTNIWKAPTPEVTGVSVDGVVQWTRAGQTSTPWLPTTQSPTTLTSDKTWTWQTSDGYLYLYSTTHPGGKIVEGCVRDIIVSNGNGGLVFDGLEFRHAADRALYLNNSTGATLAKNTVTGCTFKLNGYKSNSGVISLNNLTGGARITGCLFDGNTNDATFVAASPNVEWDSNTVQNVFRWESDGVQFQGTNAGALGVGCNGANVHHNSIDLTGSDSQKGCILLNGPYGTSGYVGYNTCVGGNFGIQIAQNGLIVERNLCHGQIGDSTYQAGLYVAGDSWAVSDCIIRYNTVYGSNWGISVTNKGFDKRRFTIIHNTLVDNDGGIQTIDPTSGVIENNIVWDTAGTKQRLLVTAVASGESLTVDYNIYGPTTRPLFARWLGTSYANITALRTASGQDAATTTGDPLFVDRAGHDYHLATGSPALGTAVTLTGVGQTTTNRGAN